MCQTELDDRRISFAISATGCRSISFNRRSCSGTVHALCGRLDRIPILLANLRQAHRGFPDSATSLVTRMLSSVPAAFIFARTRSRAALDQRKAGLLLLLFSASIFVIIMVPEMQTFVAMSIIGEVRLHTRTGLRVFLSEWKIRVASSIPLADGTSSVIYTEGKRRENLNQRGIKCRDLDS